MTLKTIDQKGRLTLGREFAGRTVQVEEEAEGELVVRFYRVVPEREAWLWENEAALSAVQRGIVQAGRWEIGDGPDMDAALKLADSIPEE